MLFGLKKHSHTILADHCLEKYEIFLSRQNFSVLTDLQLNELKNVFERHYHFEVIQQKIMAKAHPRPEHQLRKFLTDFIHNFDSPHTLYIIYYAGHGWAGDDLGHLNLAG